MTTPNSHISRRTVFRTVAGTVLAGLAGCLGDNDSGTPDDGTDPLAGQDQIERVAVEGTTLVVELTTGAEVDQINLIEPNGEFFGQRKRWPPVPNRSRSTSEPVMCPASTVSLR